MFQTEVTLNEFCRNYLKQLVASVKEDELDAQPHPEMHSIRWILAHLAIAADYGLKQFGLPFMCPMTWHVAYGPKSQPGSSARVSPTFAELMSTIDRAYSHLCETVTTPSAAQLDVPHEVAILKDTAIKTKRDLVAHLLTTHFAGHIGQLSSLRRLSGQAPLF